MPDAALVVVGDGVRRGNEVGQNFSQRQHLLSFGLRLPFSMTLVDRKNAGVIKPRSNFGLVQESLLIEMAVLGWLHKLHGYVAAQF